MLVIGLALTFCWFWLFGLNRRMRKSQRPLALFAGGDLLFRRGKIELQP